MGDGSSKVLLNPSASTSYLPLAGGELSGALTGTAATFSQQLTVGTTSSRVNAVFTKVVSTSGTFAFRGYGSGVLGDANTEHVDFFHNGTTGARIDVSKGRTG